MDISIDLTPAQIGMFIAFSIAIVGLGMAMKRRAMRKKQKAVEQDVKDHDIKKNVEHPEPTQDKIHEGKHDVDALLDSLKKDTEKE